MSPSTELIGASRVEKARLLQALLREKSQLAKTRPLASETAFLCDTSLDPAIQPCGPAQPMTAESAILLTGATGFLGAHLLHDLCRLTSATIYCLVRAGSDAQALARLEQNLACYTDLRLPTERIVAVPGDLAQPQLGLSAAAFDQLASRSDVICHNGAILNHLARYERLRAANVGSTVDLLRLAGTHKPKWMYYISSMIAATERDKEGLLLEQLPTAGTSELSGGYAQSKWASEKLLAEARRRGFGVTVYRPGIIGGRRDTGAWAVAHDHLLLLIKSCLQLRCAAASSLIVDLTPVDFVSEAIARLSLAGPIHPVIHLSNPHPLPWTTLVGWLNSFGYPVRLVPFEVWQEALARSGESNALFPLLAIYLGESLLEKRALLIAKLVKVNRALTAPMLASVNLKYPAIERELFRRYVRHCVDCGFFPPDLRSHR